MMISRDMVDQRSGTFGQNPAYYLLFYIKWLWNIVITYGLLCCIWVHLDIIAELSS